MYFQQLQASHRSRYYQRQAHYQLSHSHAYLKKLCCLTFQGFPQLPHRVYADRNRLMNSIARSQDSYDKKPGTFNLKVFKLKWQLQTVRLLRDHWIHDRCCGRFQMLMRMTEMTDLSHRCCLWLHHRNPPPPSSRQNTNFSALRLHWAVRSAWTSALAAQHMFQWNNQNKAVKLVQGSVHLQIAPVPCTHKKTAKMYRTLDLWCMTLIFNRLLHVVNVYICAKFHQAKCSSSWSGMLTGKTTWWCWKQ